MSKKDSFLKRLRKLKTYKKYKDLSQRSIDLFIEIIEKNFINIDDNMEIRPSENSICISKNIYTFIPLVWIDIINNGELKIGHCFDDYRHLTLKGTKGRVRELTICNMFNILCLVANERNEELKMELKDVLNPLKKEIKNRYSNKR